MTQTIGTQNLNQAQQNNFEITINKVYKGNNQDKLDTDIIKLWATKIPIASVNADSFKIATNINDIPFPDGAKETFSDITITFCMNENFDPYITLRRWMDRNSPFFRRKEIEKFNPSKQRTLEEWKEMAQNKGIRIKENEWEYIDYRDIIIDLKNLNNITSAKVKYVDAFPVTISSIELSNTSTDIITFNVTFKYLYMDIIGEGGNSLILC